MADGRTLVARLRATIVDNNNIRADVIAYVAVSATGRLTDITDCLQEWVGWLDEVTGGRILEYRCELFPPLPGGLKSAPLAGVNTATTGNFIFYVDGSLHTFGLAVPALSNDPGVVDAGHVVLTPGSPCANLVDFLESSPATFNFTNDNFQDLGALKEGYYSFRQHAEQQAFNSTRLA